MCKRRCKYAALKVILHIYYVWELVVRGGRIEFTAHDEPAFSKRSHALLRQIQTTVEVHTNLHDRPHLWRLAFKRSRHRSANKNRIKRTYLERKLSPVPLDDELCGQVKGEGVICHFERSGEFDNFYEPNCST